MAINSVSSNTAADTFRAQQSNVNSKPATPAGSATSVSKTSDDAQKSPTSPTQSVATPTGSSGNFINTTA